MSKSKPKSGQPKSRTRIVSSAHLAAGKRKKARTAFEQADSRGEGPVLATIDLADMLLDGGEFDAAVKRFDAALERAPKHQLAYVGRSLARSESRSNPEEAIADLNVGLAEPKGARVVAYKHLALATAWLQQEDYEAADPGQDLHCPG